MSKILELKPNVFNMIAAGEVVERPSSVIKELVENSLDAGATIVDVEISEGGLKSIKVSDNGVGMDKTDIIMSVKPHTTSKLRSAEDLSQISTFGFRGEALASIAAVSKLKITSKTKDGAAYSFSPSSNDVVETARTDGTTVEICDLFYNTPARLKFLKSTKTEEKYIVEKIADLILANPNVSISLKADGKSLLQSNGGGNEEALYAVFGNTASKFYAVDSEKGNFKLNGYISDSETTRATRSGQVIIVNGRVVEDRNLCLAVERAYGGLLMKHSYPLFVISLVLPFDFVDVNVHPQKSEVRFQSPNSVFGFVYNVVLDTLGKNQKIFTLDDELDKKVKNIESQFVDAPQISQVDLSELVTTPASENFSDSSFNRNFFDTPIVKDGKYKLRDFDNNAADKATSNTLIEKTDDGNAAKSFSKTCDLNSSSFLSSNENLNNSDSEFVKNNYSDDKSNNVAADFYGEKATILCSLFETFLIIKKGERVFLMDQHAAHERIIFDKLMESIKNEQIISQPMLFSYVEEADDVAVSKIGELMPSLEKIGFEISIDRATNHIEILAIPSILTNLKIKEFLHNLINVLDESITVETLLYERICQTACKAAIKGGDSFSEEQLEYLLKTLTKNDLPTQCPHGRPAIIEITKQSLEKLFRRVL